MVVRPEELAETLRRRAARRLEAARDRAGALRTGLARVVGELEAEGVIARGWLMGSLAWGPHREHSDVDLVVEGLDPERRGEVWNRLTDALATPVDLLRMEELPPDFGRRVRDEGIELHGS